MFVLLEQALKSQSSQSRLHHIFTLHQVFLLPEVGHLSEYSKYIHYPFPPVFPRFVRVKLNS